MNALFEGMHINRLSNCDVEKAPVKSRLLFKNVDTTSHTTFCFWQEVFIPIVSVSVCVSLVVGPLNLAN